MSPARPQLWIDASCGIAGDMLLGALLDAGAPLDAVVRAVEAVLPDTVRITHAPTMRNGLRATHATVEPLVEDHPHRHWTHIRSLIGDADLPEGVRDRALTAFEELARAEAHVHRVPIDDVHFHEVGAWDSIADIVGVCAAVEALDPSAIGASPVSLGSGWVNTSHGRLPVPAPAVLELSRQWSTSAGPGVDAPGELATPTGMALLVTLAQWCGPMPPGSVSAVGTGAGTKEFDTHPNVVRTVLLTEDSATGGHSRAAPPAIGPEEMHVLETNVDDLDPRVWPNVLSTLLGAGAADAWLTPILMKKGRPAHTLSVLCTAEQRTTLRALVFRHTSTIGVRDSLVQRVALRREWVDVEVDGDLVPVKLAFDGEELIQATPEFEDVAAVAARNGRPLAQVMHAAVAAVHSLGRVPEPPR